MKPTNEQVEIVRSILKNKSVKVKAFAGSAKTTTLQMLANAYRGKNILYLAFNSSIQKEAKNKFNGLAEVKTIHSFALGYIRKTNKKFDIRNDNYKAIEVMNLFDIKREEAYETLESFEWFCNSDLEISDFIKIESMPQKENAIKLYSKMVKAELAVTHNAYLKMFQLMLAFNDVEINYDILLVDEAQDLNNVKISIINKINSKRKVIVGDSHQQIYNFIGSVDALEKIEGEIYYLTETFRFNKEIAKYANLLLSTFKCESKEIKTNVENSEAEIKTKAFISRSNSELIKKIAFFYENEDDSFKTVSTPEKLFSLVEELFYFIVGQKERIVKNKVLLNFEDINHLEAYIDESSEDGQENELKKAKELILEYKEKILDLKEFAEKQYFKKDGITTFLTTAHTSKGLEFDEVELADDFPLSYNLIAQSNCSCLEEFQKNLPFVDRKYIEEFNLLYVAITRAKRKLNINNCSAISSIMLPEELLDSRIKEAYNFYKSKKQGGRTM